MIFQRNEGQEQDEILQNRFTGYLYSAVRRRRAQYIDEKIKEELASSLIDEIVIDSNFDLEEEALKSLPFHMRIQNDKLLSALSQLSDRERYVYLSRILDERDFEGLGTELGLSYKGVAAIYYRAVKKIKKMMKGGAL